MLMWVLRVRRNSAYTLYPASYIRSCCFSLPIRTSHRYGYAKNPMLAAHVLTLAHRHRGISNRPIDNQSGKNGQKSSTCPGSVRNLRGGQAYLPLLPAPHCDSHTLPSCPIRWEAVAVAVESGKSPYAVNVRNICRGHNDKSSAPVPAKMFQHSKNCVLKKKIWLNLRKIARIAEHFIRIRA